MRLRGLVVVLMLAAAAAAGAADWRQDGRAVQESLGNIHPRMRARWLSQHGVDAGDMFAPKTLDSSGLRLVGKWGRGPSVEVTGRDSLLFVSLGSEVAILNFADTANPRVLAEVQAMGLVTQAAVRGSFLYVGCNTGQAGIEVWSVQDPSVPVFRSRTPTLLSDFCVRDTFLYLTQSLSGPNDTFKVYSITDPENVYLLGSCRDSGDAVTVTNNAAFLADRWGLYSIDVTDPRNPHQIGTYPGMPMSVEGRGNICCVTFGNPNQPEWLEFDVLDVSNPASMQRLGFLSDAGGFDMCVADSLVFISGGSGHGFQVVGIEDSTHPVSIYSCTSPDGYGTWANPASGFGALADGSNGLVPIDVHNLHDPQFGRATLAARPTYDIDVAGSRAFLANLGLKVLDVTNPATPAEIGSVDTLGYQSQTVAVHDSFAYVEWRIDYNVAAVDVSDPTSPKLTGGCIAFNPPEDMALRDSFLFIAEDYKFQAVNVARPRQPVVVGTCGMVAGQQWGLVLRDSFAYAGSWDGLSIVNVARPTTPFVVSQTSGTRLSTDGVAVRDTFAFVPSVYETLWVYSVANPASPYPIAGAPLGVDNWGCDAAMFDDTLVFVGGKRSVVLVNVGNPAHPRAVGSYPAPSWVRRVTCSPPYLYACCTDAGVMILETTAVGVQEPGRMAGRQPTLHVTPNPAAEVVRMQFGDPLDGGGRLSLYDATGRRVLVKQVREEVRSVKLAVAGLRPGLYFVRVETKTGVLESKIVKR